MLPLWNRISLLPGTSCTQNVSPNLGDTWRMALYFPGGMQETLGMLSSHGRSKVRAKGMPSLISTHVLGEAGITGSREGFAEFMRILEGRNSFEIEIEEYV